MPKNEIIVFDANVILDLYSYKNDTVKQIISYLESIVDKLYISEQVYLEYLRNRHTTRILKRNKYSVFKENTTKTIKGAKQELDKISSVKLLSPFDTRINDKVEKTKQELDELIGIVVEDLDEIIGGITEYGDDSSDPIHTFITQVITTNKPTHFSIQDKIHIGIEADKRFQLELRRCDR